MHKYLLIILLNHNYSMMKKIIDKSSDFLTSQIKGSNYSSIKIYMGIGIGASIGKRNSKNSYLTNIHSNLRKKQFINYISKIKYTINENSPSGINPKNHLISDGESNILWNYFSSIFHKIQINNDYNIQYLLDVNFLDKINLLSKIIQERKNFAEALININYINHIFNISNSSVKLYDSLSKVFYFYGLTNYNNMKNGLTINDNLSVENRENKDWYMAKDTEVKLENSIELTNASKIINNSNINFFRQLIPLINENEIHYFILDENGKLYHWEDHKNFEYNSDSFQRVNDLNIQDTKIIFNEKTKQEKNIKIQEYKNRKNIEIQNIKNIKDPNENKKIKEIEDKYNQLIKNEEYYIETKIKGSNLKLFKNIFNNSNKGYPNYLTLMYLLEFPENTNIVVQKQQLEDFIKDLKNNKNLRDFKYESLNKIFYFLLGHHRKNISVKNGFLPYQYINFAIKDKKDLTKTLDNNKNLSSGENLYDISNYDDVENNNENLKNAMDSLPITNPMENYIIYANIILCSLYKNFICILIYNHTVYNNIISNVKENISPEILSLQGGVCIYNNLYMTLIGELLFPNFYKYNKYFDLAVGIGFIINILPLLINISFVFDLYNNIINFKLSLNVLVNVYGNKDMDNINAPYISYI